MKSPSTMKSNSTSATTALSGLTMNLAAAAAAAASAGTGIGSMSSASTHGSVKNLCDKCGGTYATLAALISHKKSCKGTISRKRLAMGRHIQQQQQLKAKSKECLDDEHNKNLGNESANYKFLNDPSNPMNNNNPLMNPFAHQMAAAAAAAAATSNNNGQQQWPGGDGFFGSSPFGNGSMNPAELGAFLETISPMLLNNQLTNSVENDTTIEEQQQQQQQQQAVLFTQQMVLFHMLQQLQGTSQIPPLPLKDDCDQMKRSPSNLSSRSGTPPSSTPSSNTRKLLSSLMDLKDTNPDAPLPPMMSPPKSAEDGAVGTSGTSSFSEPNTLELLQKHTEQALQNTMSGGSFLLNGSTDNGDLLCFRKGKDGKEDPASRHRCRYCGKVFGSDSALQIHIRSHTGERPFKCNVCGNRFTTKGNLKVHFQRHKAKYPHVKMNPHPVPEHLDKFHPPLEPPSNSQSPPPAPPGFFSSSGSSTNNMNGNGGANNNNNFSNNFHIPAIFSSTLIPFGTDSDQNGKVNDDTSKTNANDDVGKKTTKSLFDFSELYLNNLEHNNKLREDSGRHMGLRMSESDANPSDSKAKNLDDESNSQMEMDVEMNGLSEVDDEQMDDEDEDDDNTQYGSSPGTLPSSSFSLMGLPFGMDLGQLPNHLGGGGGGGTGSMSASAAFAGGARSETDSDLGEGASKDPIFYQNLLPKPGSTDSTWETLMEVQKASETVKLQQLVDNIEHKLKDPNQCFFCKRVLSCKSALQMHYRTHTGERPFKCKICGRAFTTKGNLKTHMGVHRVKPPLRMMHQCPICHKQFTNALVLQQHIRTHTGEAGSGVNMSDHGANDLLAELKNSPLLPSNFPRSFLPPGFGLPFSIPPMGLPSGLFPPSLMPDMTSAAQHQMNNNNNNNNKSSNNANLFGNGSYGSGSSISLNESSEIKKEEPDDGEEEDDADVDIDQKNNVEEDNVDCEKEPSEHANESDANDLSLNRSKRDSLRKRKLSVQTKLIDQQQQQQQHDNQDSQFGSHISDATDLDDEQQLQQQQQQEISNLFKTKKIDNSFKSSKSNQSIMTNNGKMKDIEPQTNDSSISTLSALENHVIKSISQVSPSQPPSKSSLFGNVSTNVGDLMLPKASTPNVLDLTPKSMGHESNSRSPTSSESRSFPPTPFAGLPFHPTGRPNTTCRICCKTFACFSALEIHIRSHTKERPFKCEVCDRGFSTKGNMKQHMLTHKIRDLPPDLYTTVSPPANTTLGNFLTSNNISKILRQKHQQQQHQSSGGTNQSSSNNNSNNSSRVSSPHTPTGIGGGIIGSNFGGCNSNSVDSTDKNMIRNSDSPVGEQSSGSSSRTAIGNGTNKHMCRICNKPFSSGSALQIHMRTHTGDKPFKCTICGRAFTTKGNLKVHMGTHMWNSNPSRRGRRMSIDLPNLHISPPNVPSTGSNQSDSTPNQSSPNADLFFPYLPSHLPGFLNGKVPMQIN
ncbi:Sal-like protein 1 [Blomia tropicalis]|nr:Sal-like protein 1 [Blomia tropicalis]